MIAGQQALGLLPEPMVRVHSLAALTEQMNGSNTRALIKAAKEQGHTLSPVDDSESPTAYSLGCSKHSTASESVQGATQNVAAPGPAAAGPLANSASAADDTAAQGTSNSAEAPAEGSGQGSGSCLAEKHAGARKASRLSGLVSRFRRRKPTQAPAALSSPAGHAAERSDVQGSPAQPSSSAASQLSSPSGALRPSSSAAPEQAPVPRLGDRPAAGPGASGHSSSAAAGSGSDAPHGAGAAPAPAPDAVQLDWGGMNESMMHSLHMVISSLTTVLIAQVSARPCKAPSCNVTSSSVWPSPADAAQLPVSLL